MEEQKLSQIASPEHFEPIFLHVRDFLERYLKPFTNIQSILEILIAGTKSSFVSLVPVLHKESCQLKTCKINENCKHEINLTSFLVFTNLSA